MSEQSQNFFNKNKITILIIIAIIAILISLIPLGYYIYHFYSNPISTTANDWGPFGDFFGGVLNPYFSFLTLLVTIYIAYEISQLEDKRNEKTIKFENERNEKIMEFENKKNEETIKFEKRKFMSELRVMEYRRVMEGLQTVMTIFGGTGSEKEIHRVVIEFHSFGINYTHLFPFVQDPPFSKLANTLIKLFDASPEPQKKKGAKKLTPKESDELYRKYIDLVEECSLKMQKYILEEI